MFYVSAINKNTILSITDTEDNVTEQYPINKIDVISKQIEIQGYIDKENIFVIKPLSEVVRHFNYGNYEKGLRYMGNWGFELLFQSKARSNGDGTSFRSNYGIRIYRNNFKYSYYDENNKYHSGVSVADISSFLQWYYGYNTLTMVRILN
jgi:hypothetical protein